MPLSVLFRVQKVKIPYLEYDLPGPSKKKAVCVKCGQVVRDGKEITVNSQPYCQPCAHGAYFEDPVEINVDEL
jgi:formylmethanofuran dehydrogenase subunit E